MPTNGSSLLVSRKLVMGDHWSEGSGTAKVGTDEQESYMRLYSQGKVTQRTNAYNQQGYIVDMAVIDRKNMLLPGEISLPRVGWEKSADTIVPVRRNWNPKVK